jgi:hypothetical protein
MPYNTSAMSGRLSGKFDLTATGNRMFSRSRPVAPTARKMSKPSRGLLEARPYAELRITLLPRAIDRITRVKHGRVPLVIIPMVETVPHRIAHVHIAHANALQ